MIQPLEIYEQVEKVLEKCIPPQCQRKFNEIMKCIENKVYGAKEGQKKISEFEK